VSAFGQRPPQKVIMVVLTKRGGVILKFNLNIDSLLPLARVSRDSLHVLQDVLSNFGPF
jgi:hypothetical protein